MIYHKTGICMVYRQNGFSCGITNDDKLGGAKPDITLNISRQI